jgi:hypothetical protein
VADEIANGWTPEDLERMRALVLKEYPLSGTAGYQPSKTALDLLSSLPRDRAKDFVAAVRNYAYKVKDQETKWTRGLTRFLEDGFWEQYIKRQSSAKKVTSQSSSTGRDINGEADAASHAVKMQNVRITAFEDWYKEEAS